jgi:hypothetical protein
MYRQVSAGHEARPPSISGADHDREVLIGGPDFEALRSPDLVGGAGEIIAFDVEEGVAQALARVQGFGARGESDSARWSEPAEKRIGGPTERLRQRASSPIEQLEADIAVDPAADARPVSQLEIIEDMPGCGTARVEADF